MISYIRHNMVAFVALFVAIVGFGGTAAYAANTIRSSDIVDGQVKNQDIADNAIGTGKIQDGSVLGVDIKHDSLSGANIKESTLGEVPNAEKIDGVGFSELQSTTVAFDEETDTCSEVGLWAECGAMPLTVPAGHQYLVTVTSSVTANPGATGAEIAYCPATTVPTCFAAGPEIMSLPANTYTNASTAATKVFEAGTYTISTALHVLAPLLHTANADTSTTISYSDVTLVKQNQ
jgi:hypothetical protein